jgi:hypothetical protein
VSTRGTVYGSEGRGSHPSERAHEFPSRRGDASSCCYVSLGWPDSGCSDLVGGDVEVVGVVIHAARVEMAVLVQRRGDVDVFRAPAITRVENDLARVAAASQRIRSALDHHGASRYKIANETHGGRS